MLDSSENHDSRNLMLLLALILLLGLIAFGIICFAGLLLITGTSASAHLAGARESSFVDVRRAQQHQGHLALLDLDASERDVLLHHQPARGDAGGFEVCTRPQMVDPASKR